MQSKISYLEVGLALTSIIVGIIGIGISKDRVVGTVAFIALLGISLLLHGFHRLNQHESTIENLIRELNYKEDIHKIQKELLFIKVGKKWK
jgi:hypothetical protein